MTATRQRVLLWLTLLGTIAAAWALSEDGNASDVIASAVVRPGMSDATQRSAAASAAGSLALPSLSRRTPHGDDEVSTLFDALPWQAPLPAASSPPASAVVLVAPVVADAGPPPLPFRPLGRYDDSSGPVIFLMYQDQNLIVRRGDDFANQYRLEEINGAVLSIRHLLSNQVQTLDMGSGT